MPKRKKKVKRYVSEYRQHSFHWQTDIPEDEQTKIKAWLKALSKEEALMLYDLISDARDNAVEDYRCGSDCCECSCI